MSTTTHVPSRTSLWRFGFVVAVFFAVWSGKLWTIGHYGTDVPYWDQWGKEGDLFYRPWFERHEFWPNLFVPHNEHRIAPTLALNLALVKLGGDQWDARVQCVASAALHALIMAGLAAWALRRLAPRWAIAVGVLLVIVAAPPIAWENVLGGFQSQFYFLAGFSLLAIAGMLGAQRFSWGWLGGLAAAIVASVSMGSGMLVAVPLVMIAASRLIRRAPVSDQVREPVNGITVVTLVAGLALGAVGFYFRAKAEWHVPLHAHSLSQYVSYVARCLAWPRYDFPWLSVLLWAPWTVFCFRWLRRSNGVADFIVAGGGWVLLQVAAVSFSRAGGSGPPAPRYGDIFALGVGFNALAFAISAPRSRLLLGAALSWAVVVTVCVSISTHEVVHRELPQKRLEHQAYEQNVHAFVLTDDDAHLAKPALIPFPFPDWLARMIRNPALRHLLPVSIRPPLPIAGLAAPSAGSSLRHRATRHLSVGEQWESVVLPPSPYWWKFETTGDVLADGADLELVAASDHRVLARVRPSKPPGETWRAAYVPGPREPAFLRARVKSPARTLGFSEPIEMSALSYWGWRLTQQAVWLGGFASLVLVALAARGIARGRRSARTDTAIPASGSD